jgi:hypothetical protein
MALLTNITSSRPGCAGGPVSKTIAEEIIMKMANVIAVGDALRPGMSQTWKMPRSDKYQTPNDGDRKWNETK